MLLLGDCNHWLKEIKDNSIDLIVTDPPYGIEFMGKDWDKALVSTETWKECYRVLKQGKLAFVMCSPRQDVLARMIIHLQDAGFRTNYTSIYWTYASGFPKAANVSKLIDKRNGTTEQESQQFADYIKSKRLQLGLGLTEVDKFVCDGSTNYSWFEGRPAGQRLPRESEYQKIKQILKLDNRFDDFIGEAEREVIGKNKTHGYVGDSNWNKTNVGYKADYDITKPATEEAKKMEGAYVGFQPKPAVEVILVVSKGKTLTWLDDCRIPYQSDKDVYFGHHNKSGPDTLFNNTDIENNVYADGWKRQPNIENEKGRFPANLLVQDDILNDGKIYKTGGVIDNWGTGYGGPNANVYGKGGKVYHRKTDKPAGEQGSYSRYFSLDAWSKTFPFLICAKASKAERNKGCEDLPKRDMRFFRSHNGTGEPIGISKTHPDGTPKTFTNKQNNHHPTVKPLKLMSYLITMGSREGDLVLDPFCGSGTVCIAADNLHRKWLGIERNEEYAEIIKKRLMVPLSQLKLTTYA